MPSPKRLEVRVRCKFWGPLDLFFATSAGRVFRDRFTVYVQVMNIYLQVTLSFWRTSFLIYIYCNKVPLANAINQSKNFRGWGMPTVGKQSIDFYAGNPMAFIVHCSSVLAGLNLYYIIPSLIPSCPRQMWAWCFVAKSQCQLDGTRRCCGEGTKQRSQGPSGTKQSSQAEGSNRPSAQGRPKVVTCDNPKVLADHFTRGLYRIGILLMYFFLHACYTYRLFSVFIFIYIYWCFFSHVYT